MDRYELIPDQIQLSVSQQLLCVTERQVPEGCWTVFFIVCMRILIIVV